MRKMLDTGDLKSANPLLPEVLNEAVEMQLMSKAEAEKLHALAEAAGWAHLYLCEKQDGSWILSS